MHSGSYAVGSEVRKWGSLVDVSMADGDTTPPPFLYKFKRGTVWPKQLN